MGRASITHGGIQFTLQLCYNIYATQKAEAIIEASSRSSVQKKLAESPNKEKQQVGFFNKGLEKEIIEKGGYDDLSVSKDEIDDFKVTLYSPVHTGENNLEHIVYQVYKSERAVKKRLAQIPKELHDSPAVVDDTVEGYLEGVCDADIQLFACRYGKMIVMTQATYCDFYSDEEGDYINQLNQETREIYKECKDFIVENYKQ